MGGRGLGCTLCFGVAGTRGDDAGWALELAGVLLLAAGLDVASTT